VYFCKKFKNYILIQLALDKSNRLKILITAFFGTIIAITFGHFNAVGQEPLSANYHFEQDTVHIGYGETFSNLLRFENHGRGRITFFKVKVTAGSLLNLPDSVSIEPGKSRSFPVKYLSSASTVKHAVQEFSASYRSPDVSLSAEASFQAVIREENRMSLSAIDPVSYLNNATNRTSIRLRCANTGYTPVQVMLKVTSYPTGLQFSRRHNK
jgi:hypothetical protein